MGLLFGVRGEQSRFEPKAASLPVNPKLTESEPSRYNTLLLWMVGCIPLWNPFNLMMGLAIIFELVRNV